MSDMGVLVTGASGFIGGAVAAALRAVGRSVATLSSADGDIAAPATLQPWRNAGITSVVHCAGRTYVPDSWNDPAGFAATNIVGTTQILEFCRATGARLVHISAYVYGQPERLPIPETAPVRANNPYALSKYLAEQACRFHAEYRSVPVTILRPFNIYGPLQPEKFLIPTILSQLRHGETVEMMDLEPRRDYVFLDDLVDAILRAEARAVQGCAVLNIGSGMSYSVAEIVAAAQRVAGTGLAVTSRKTVRSNEIPDVVADITAARAALGWAPSHSLVEGLEKCWRAAKPAALEQCA